MRCFMNIRFFYGIITLFPLMLLSMDEPVAQKDIVLESLTVRPESHKFSPLGDKLLVHAKEDGCNDLRIYKTATGKLIKKIPVIESTKYKWSPKGSFILTRTRDAVQIYKADASRITQLEVPIWFHVRFSDDERCVYSGDKLGKSNITVFESNTGKQLAQLSTDGRLGVVDPLNKQIASVNEETVFFSADSFEKSGGIPARLTCYSNDGSLMGAYSWADGESVHSLFNRMLQCITKFDSGRCAGCFATINPAKTILTAYYTDVETNIMISNPEQKVRLNKQFYVHKFSSWDGTRRITLKQESKLPEDYSKPTEYSTRVFITDLADETLDMASSIVLKGSIDRIFYTSDPNVILVGKMHVLNLKTKQIVNTAYGTSAPMVSKQRKIKHLVSALGMYLAAKDKNGQEAMTVAQLDWNKAP